MLTESHSGLHWRLCRLQEHSGIQFDLIWVSVQSLEGVCNVRFGIDLLELVVCLEPEKLPKLIQGRHLPLPSLDNPQDLDGLQNIRHMVCAKAAYGFAITCESNKPALIEGCDWEGNTARVLDALLQDLDQFVVVKHPLIIPLEPTEGSDGRIVRNLALKLPDALQQLGQ